jgi:hypothetical protein
MRLTASAGCGTLTVRFTHMSIVNYRCTVHATETIASKIVSGAKR